MTLWYVFRPGGPATPIKTASQAPTPDCQEGPYDDTINDELKSFLGIKNWGISKSTLIDKLNAAGLLPALDAALKADLYTRELWYASDKSIYLNNSPWLTQLMSTLKADPAVVLAKDPTIKA